MSKPFFSVIVPAHNAEGFLAKCLHSVKMQKFEDYELIVVCDNCTDNTAKVALGYADRVITTHCGMDGLARNAGIDAAAGEWILFLDHDDWWIHEYVMTEIYKLIKRLNNEVDLIVFDFLWKGVGYYVNQANRMNIAVWTKAFRREFIGNTRFPPIEFTSDENFMNDILARYPRCYKLDRLMYYYDYMRPGSQTEQHKNGGGC
jgi:glycosyltransferase involved in cell wall biosynthesis